MGLREVLETLVVDRNLAAERAGEALAKTVTKAFGDDPVALLAKLGDATTREAIARGVTKRVAPQLIRDAEEAGVRAGRGMGGEAATLSGAKRRGFSGLLERGVLYGMERAGLQVTDVLRRTKAEGRDPKSVKEQLAQDWTAQGPVTGTITRSGVWTKEASGIVTTASQQSMNASLGYDTAKATQWRWVAAGRNVCPVCESRHGSIAPWIEWRKAGLPGTSFGNPCGRNCRCILVPVFVGGEDLGPIVDG